MTPDDVIAWLKRFWWIVALILALILTLWAWEKVKAVVTWPFRAGAEALCLDGTDCHTRELEADNERLRSAVRSAVAESLAQEAVNEASEQAHREVLETRTIIVQAQAEAEGAPDA